MAILKPTTVKNITQAADVAFDGKRARPVVAINEKGQLVVCCRRTAAKNGWELEGAMYQRSPKAKVVISSKGKLVVGVPQKKRAIVSNAAAVIEELLK